MTKLSDHERSQSGTVTLSAEQFDKLVELLTPGFELSQMYLKQMHEHPEPAEADKPEDGDKSDAAT